MIAEDDQFVLLSQFNFDLRLIATEEYDLSILINITEDKGNILFLGRDLRIVGRIEHTSYQLLSRTLRRQGAKEILCLLDIYFLTLKTVFAVRIVYENILEEISRAGSPRARRRRSAGHGPWRPSR